jgi:DNA-binding response OmpR family regulator
MLKVMIVDQDVRLIREITDEIGLHYTLLNCSRGTKALELLKAFQPDALIMDPATPDLNSQELITEARCRPGMSRTPVLLLTHFTTIRHIEKSFDWGADFVFSKPCSTDRISRKLAECIERANRYRHTQLVEL